MSLDFISMNYDKNSAIMLISFQIQMVWKLVKCFTREYFLWNENTYMKPGGNWRTMNQMTKIVIEEIDLKISSVKCPRWQSLWANMGPTWVLSAADGPRVGPVNLAIRGTQLCQGEHG